VTLPARRREMTNMLKKVFALVSISAPTTLTMIVEPSGNTWELELQP
jgi:hypothetical protein